MSTVLHYFIDHVAAYVADKGQVVDRYYGLCANAHRGKVRKKEVPIS